MVSSTELLIAVISIVTGSGLLFEIGRRIGESSATQSTTETDVSKLGERMNEKFSELDARLNKTETARKAENKIIIRWMSELTDVLREEGYNVERPDEINEDIDITRSGYSE
jgi:hypothetical protein